MSGMIKNYLKTALRIFFRHKGYSFINIFGLAVGMACCLLILLYVRHELSYDRYHQDTDRIYRISMDIRTGTSNRVFAPISPTAGPALKNDYPQVEYVARVLPTSTRLVKKEDRMFYEDRFMWADKELLDIFNIPFVEGDVRNALTRPNTLVISERMAYKYFGDKSPLGKTLNINTVDYEITGVVANSPDNTHLKYDLIASMKSWEGSGMMSNWHSTMFYTYFKLVPNVDVDEFSRQVSRLADKYVKERLDSSGVTYHYFLQPVTRIHLYSHLRYEVEPAGNPIYLYIFSVVGVFILLIACMNFMNLTTARSANRAKEVGMRKVVGAQRRQIMGQFLGESLLVSVLAFILAVVVTGFCIPYVSNLTGINLESSDLAKPGLALSLIGMMVLVGLAAGIYPAFVLSAFRPVTAIKGTLSRGARGSGMRKVLVVGQFAISIILVIGTFVVHRQLHFMKNQHLGFEKEQKLILPIRGGISIEENYAAVKDRFLKHPSVLGAAVSSTVPGRGVSNFGIRLVGEEDVKNQSMFHLYFDHDFIPEYGIEMVAGRAFEREMSTDVGGAFLINEAALKAFGWSMPEEAIGKRLLTGYGGRVSPIIGVIKNFHYRGLQTMVEPLVMEFLPELFDTMTLRIDTRNLNGALAYVEDTWKELFPANPFEYFFLDTDFDRQYRADEQVGRIFSLFTFLGLFIACLGLLGLASFTTEQRTKEIGIRKALGSSVSGIIVLLLKEFVRWVLAANFIAWPVAYLAINKWLENFAYRTRIGLWIFALSAGLAMFIALATVCFQSVKAALANPADSLRYE